ncbi:MAG: hypothetical protein ABR601_03435 [Parasphingopyxis sp.]
MRTALISLFPRAGDALRALGGASLVIATSLALGLPASVVFTAV